MEVVTVTVTVMVVKLLAVLGTIGLCHASQVSPLLRLPSDRSHALEVNGSDQMTKNYKLKIIKCIFLVLRSKQLFKIVF